MTKEALIELANLYFKRHTEEERREIRRDFQAQADKKTAKNWAIAESQETPELHYLVREEFFRFFAYRQQIGIDGVF